MEKYILGLIDTELCSMEMILDSLNKRPESDQINNLIEVRQKEIEQIWQHRADFLTAIEKSKR